MRSGTLLLTNINDHITVLSMGDTVAIYRALIQAGKKHPNLGAAIIKASIELDEYPRTICTGEILSDMIFDNQN